MKRFMFSKTMFPLYRASFIVKQLFIHPFEERIEMYFSLGCERIPVREFCEQKKSKKETSKSWNQWTSVTRFSIVLEQEEE